MVIRVNFQNIVLFMLFVVILNSTVLCYSQDFSVPANNSIKEIILNSLEDQERLNLIIHNLNSLSLEDLNYILVKIQFKITHEGKDGLQPYFNIIKQYYKSKLEQYRLKKKIAIIYGREINLLDGEWKVLPDGRRYWVSNEYPEIVLSSAEYSRYWATAITVED